MPFTSAEAAVLLNRYRGTQPGTMANTYVGILTVLPDNTGSGGTEASYAGYARKRVDNVLGSPSSKQVANTSAIAFDAPSSATGVKARGWALYDASSGGNMLHWQPYANEQRSFSASSSTDVITAPGHAYNDNDVVRFFDADDSTLPTGVAEGTSYYVINTNQVAGTFKVSASEGGATIDLTAAGNGIVCRVTEIALNAGSIIQFPIGGFVIRLF